SIKHQHVDIVSGLKHALAFENASAAPESAGITFRSPLPNSVKRLIKPGNLAYCVVTTRFRFAQSQSKRRITKVDQPPERRESRNLFETVAGKQELLIAVDRSHRYPR